MTDTEGTPTGDETTTVDTTEEELGTAVPSSEESPSVQRVAQSEDVDSTDTPAEDPDTFPRSYVEKLRGQNARYRERGKQADLYAQRLHLELVKATGRLADPSDLEFDEDHLDDPDTLAAAVDDLLARKPHLASRKPAGDIGQGQRGAASEPFSLLGLLKERT
jgi:hypothetical protein